MASRSVLRITKEINELQKGDNLTLSVAHLDEDVRKVKALVMGPHETPYEFGFFEFSIQFSKDYPIKAPAVKALTTNKGSTRFNPNIYSEGKVCLSILGTWRGEAGEEWSSAQSLESVLLSIQSLMCSNPYENEPGFEKLKSESDKVYAQDYAAKIRHETIQISVIQRLETLLGIEGPQAFRTAAAKKALFQANLDKVEDEAEKSFSEWDPFSDLLKLRFLWYYHIYLDRIHSETHPKPETDENNVPSRVEKKVEQAPPPSLPGDYDVSPFSTFYNSRTRVRSRPTGTKDGTVFTLAPFEMGSNVMNGTFNYTQLINRLHKIKAALDAETDSWESAGMQALRRDSPTALWFQNTFNNIVNDYKRRSVPINLELIEGNPFAWRLMFFGAPMTNLDGGIFKIKIVFSTNFPAEQPRVCVETPLFHQRISPDGVLCYLPEKKTEVESHVTSIIQSIQEENPPYDPRTMVNVETWKLKWGNADEQKIYNRKLRRSVQASSEADEITG